MKKSRTQNTKKSYCENEVESNPQVPHSQFQPIIDQKFWVKKIPESPLKAKLELSACLQLCT